MKKLSIFIIFIAIISCILLCIGKFFYKNPLYIIEPKFDVPTIKSSFDKDKDGINDTDDIVQGARNEIINKTKYIDAYYTGGFPPNNEGVCTDVIWRALKNAGYDLKTAIDTDTKKNIGLYPRVHGKPDPNIDFRRVSNQLVFFKRHAQTLTNEVIPNNKENLSQWQAGDIVIFQSPKIDHIAIISDKRRKDGVPYIIHNSSPIPEENAYYLTSWSKAIVGHFRYGDK